MKTHIPTIEATVDANAYEARMHFLCPDSTRFGKYNILPVQVSSPTAEAAQKELPLDQAPGLLLWVDFSEPEIIDAVESGCGDKRYQIESHKIGEVAVAVRPKTLLPYSEVLADEDEPNSFMKLWIGIFAMDRSKDSFGQRRHPLDAIYELYKRMEIEEELESIRSRTQNGREDDTVKALYCARLAQAAMRDFPNMLSDSGSALSQQLSKLGASGLHS